MKNYVKTLAMVGFFAAALVATGALAQGNVFDTATGKMLEVFKNVRTVVFIFGGFGLIGLAIGAIMGKIKWMWLATLAIGLAIVAVAGQVVEYATSTDGGMVTDADWQNLNM